MGRTTAGDVAIDRLAALLVGAVLAVLVAALGWAVVMLALGALFIAGISGPDSVVSLAPVGLLALGVAALVRLVRVGWWERGWRKIAVVAIAVATVGYGGVVVEAAPVLYAIGAPYNGWTLSEMLRLELVRIEELDVGACMNDRYRSRGAPPSDLVQPADCAGPHNAEVVGIHLVGAPAHRDDTALQQLGEELCEPAWEGEQERELDGAGDVHYGEVLWIVRRDGSPQEHSVVCGVDDAH